jgi:plastocyanin domain-containing protein
MSKVLVTITVIAIVIGGIYFLENGSSQKGGQSNSESANIDVKDKVQYISIEAKGGYSPRVTSAKSGVPTKLIVKTNNTYDCSSALVIRSVGFQSMLPQTGETEIDLGIHAAGETIQGLCSMGMYSFQIKFI